MTRLHRLRPTACSAALAALLTTVAASAQPSEPAPSPSAPAPAPAPSTTPAPSPPNSPVPSNSPVPTPAPLSVWLDAGHSGLDRERIRAAIARELAVDVTLSETADTPLRVTINGDRLQVAYSTASGEHLSRTVELPSDSDRAVEVIALMVGNLTRDEAAELLAELEKSRAAPKPVAAAATAAAAAKPPEPEPLIRATPSFNLSLYHPISLSPDSERRVISFELGLVYGRVGAIEGFGLDLGVLKVERDARGFVAGVFTSIVKGHTRGLHLSAIYSGGYGGADRLNGVNAAGLVSQQQGEAKGLSLGGLASLTGSVQGAAVGGALVLNRDIVGATVAGLATYQAGPKPSEGALISGVTNISPGLTGAAIAGIANVTKNIDGFALAGIANVTGDLDGAALSFVNVSQKVRGVQFGVVNVAKEVDGAQIGVINVAKNSRFQLEAFASNLAPITGGFKFVSGYAYSELLVAYQPDNNYVDFSPGIGAHLPLPAPANQAAIELGVRGSFSYDQKFNTETPERMDLIYEGRFTYRVLPFLEPFIGGGARQGMYSTTKGDVDPELFGGLAVGW